MKTMNEVRSLFLQFFESKNHTVCQSASLVPENDPTLMFTVAGMVPFKNVFTGEEKRPYTRATSSQKCVRAGGKHNDLENVGHTARHHTFFEMLGNFSFGDYFKEQAIPFAWEFVTSKEWLGLDTSRLYVTVYHTDEDAYRIWNEVVGLPEDRIIRISTKDNFWSAGDTGPCGPCTEIFFDNGPEVEGGLPGTPEEDGDRYLEIWNVVFMQYDRQADGEMKPLAQTGVDTGAGLERITAVAQGHQTNYHMDLFQNIFAEMSALIGKTWGTDKETTASMNVIADHLRAMTFLIGDGVMPSNEGSGYVLRRIMRRAMRHANLLGKTDAFIYKMIPTLIEQYKAQYPELAQAEKMIMDTVKLEEERFLRTLNQGLKLLSEETADFKEGDVLSGSVAFKLYDTYGFPLDLTEDALKERNITVDTDGFEKEMEAQRERARAAGLGGAAGEKLAKAWLENKANTAATEFTGYDSTEDTGSVTLMVKAGEAVESISAGDEAVIATTQTPFYAESGGQVGDTGTITTVSGAKLAVVDTQKVLDGHFFQHFVKVIEGSVKTGDEVTLTVDADRRDKVKRNHSATHLMHTVLREVLGDHIFQKGSHVDDMRTRFDFSHQKALTAEEITEIEKRVNARIWANAKVTCELMDKDAAVEAGAMALFGEKYDAEVRVLTMAKGDTKYSVELCGGIHVETTGEIGLFKLSTQSAVSAGVRRIEAITGEAAFNMLADAESLLKETANNLKVAQAEVPARVKALAKERKELSNEVKKLQKAGAASGGKSHADTLLETQQEVSGVKFISGRVDVEGGTLRELVDDLKNRVGSGVILLASGADDKVTLVAGVTKDLISKYKAGEIVNAAAEKVGGRGGGRPDMAMAGGKDVAAIAQALEAGQSKLS